MCQSCALWSASFGCVNESGWTCFYSCSSSLCPANTGPEIPPPWILEGWVHPPPCPPASAFPLASPAMGPDHRGMGRDSHAHWRPRFLLLCWLVCMAQQKCHAPAQLRTQVKIRIYLGHRLDLQDGLLLKREEITNQASLTNHNAQISLLNILSDLECSSQEGNRQYLFCNPALL